MAKVLLVSLYEINYMGTRLLASWLRANGHETYNIFFKDLRWASPDVPLETHSGYQLFYNGAIEVPEYNTKKFTKHETELLEEAIRNFTPDIVGFSTRSTLEPFVPELLGRLRAGAPKALLVAGGYGPTLRPEWYLEQGFNVVVRGDGEEALLELADNISAPERCRATANTSWRVNTKEFIHNPLRPQEKNIDRYPPPLHGDPYCAYIEDNALYEHCDPLGSPYSAFATKGMYCTFLSRGCTGHCTYCSGGQWTSLYHKDNARPVYKCRLRNLDDVLKELESIDLQKFSYINFVDECFALNKEKALYFFCEYKKRIHLPFSIYLDYEKSLNNRDLFEVILDAGFDHTGVGVQTGSEEFARQYYKRNGHNTVYIDYIKLLYDSFVSSRIQFIGGNCYEDEEHFKETLQFIKQLPFDIGNPLHISFNIIRLSIFPQAPLATLAPRTVSEPMSATEWWRRALLMELRRFVPDDEMDALCNDAVYRRDPEKLRAYYHRRLHETQVAAFTALLPSLHSRELIFVGIGAQWQKNQEFFRKNGIRPSLFAVNGEYLDGAQHSLDGIPLEPLEKVFAASPDAEIVIFAEQATAICRSLIRGYGMNPSKLHACAPLLPLCSGKD